MKTVILITICAMFAGAASAQVYVEPHYRKNGTFVEGHMRSAPNQTKIDNYSSKGNSNPFTGRQGTVDPYRQAPSFRQPSYVQ